MTTATQPRNAHEALAQALRLERARQIIAEGYTFEKDRDFDSVAVVKPGTTAAAYWIVDGECDCPDRMKGNKCKHEMAYALIQAEADKTKSLFDEDVAAMEAAMCEQYERENAEPELPAYDAQRILMLSELRRAEQGAKQYPDVASWRGRVKQCENALHVYDEVAMKQRINFYKQAAPIVEKFNSGWECGKDLAADRI